MPDFRLTAPDGASYKITAPDESAAMQAFNEMMGASSQAAPAEPMQPPVQEWGQLAQRLDARQANMSDYRQPPQVAVEQARIDEAKRQGLLHGLKEGPGNTYGREMSNQVALGLPNYLEAATSGFGTSLTTPENHEFIKAADKGRAESNPWAAAGGDLTAALAQGLILPGVSAATRTGRVAQGAAQGAGLMATQGLIESRGDLGRAAKEGALGAVGGAAGTYAADKIGGAIGNYLNKKAVLKSAPSIDDLKTQASDLYKQAEKLGVKYAQPAVDDMAQNLGDVLLKEGIDKDNTPKAWRVFQRIWQDTGGNVSLPKLDILRKVAQTAANAPDPNERRLGSIIIDHIDDFVQKAGPNDVLSGDPTQAAGILTKARELWQASKRGGMVAELMDNAEITAAATHSGQNVNNAMRQKFAAILKNPAKRRGFTPEQLAAMRAVVDGSKIGNLSRNVGKLFSNQGLGGVVSASAGAGAGAAVGGVPGAVVGGLLLPAVGGLARKIGDRATQNAAKYADALARIPASQRQKMIAAIQNQGRRPTAQQLQFLSALLGAQGVPALTTTLTNTFSPTTAGP